MSAPFVGLVGCASIVQRLRADTHHRPLRRCIGLSALGVPGNCTCETEQRNRNSPFSHAMTSRLASMVRTRSPLASVFSLMALRWLVWIVWPAADAVRGVWCVFMARIFAGPSIPVHVQKQEIRT